MECICLTLKDSQSGYSSELEDYQEAVESQLNLLESTPLTEGGAYPWPKGMVDKQLFSQNQIYFIEEELETFDDDETADGNDVFQEYFSQAN